MKRLILFYLIYSVSLTSFGQKMQEFNQAYSEREAEIDSAKNLNKTIPDSNSINKVYALPGFTDLLGKNFLLPQIEIQGMTNFGSRDSLKGDLVYGEIKVFTSALSQKSFSNVGLFFPETSIYGISMTFNLLPFKEYERVMPNGTKKDIKWFCIYGNFSYLGKNIQGVSSQSDTTKFASDFIQTKLGLQVIPLINILSFYADFNSMMPVVNRAPFSEYNPTMKKGFTNYWNLGTKFFLASSADKPLKVFIDFSCILVNKITKTIFQTEDALIPRISIGGTKKF